MNRTGTQSLERGARLLRELAARGTLGWRLSDLARRCELDKGTAHRIIACLVRERLVRQRPGDRRYVPGPLLFELSLALPGYAAFQAAAARPLAAAAGALGGYAFLCLRSGSDFVCAANAGRASVKALEHDVGLRRPLMVSAGGMAILVALPAEEAAAIAAENMRRVQAAGEVRVKAVERMLRRSQAHGCGVHLSDIVPGVNTYAAAIRDTAGRPFASVAVAGRAEDLPLSRLPAVLRVLHDAALGIGAQGGPLLEL
ncbi:MAG TPA: helix-turn-helix domain-containing protein [Burkholderiales bacterium]|nr:helix-turn-helix domain-containing protein [Burkholderiales bacterium]